MKLSDSFDPRCLRGQVRGLWRWRLASGLSALLLTLAILVLLVGLASLFNYGPLPGPHDDSPLAAMVLLLLGLPALLLGIFAWRLCRRRLRRCSELSIARHLLKKRD